MQIIKAELTEPDTYKLMKEWILDSDIIANIVEPIVDPITFKSIVRVYIADEKDRTAFVLKWGSL